jgi:hypothetical protein
MSGVGAKLVRHERAVRDDLQPLGHGGGDLEDRLEVGLVEARERTPRICGLELREGHRAVTSGGAV